MQLLLFVVLLTIYVDISELYFIVNLSIKLFKQHIKYSEIALAALTIFAYLAVFIFSIIIIVRSLSDDGKVIRSIDLICAPSVLIALLAFSISSSQFEPFIHIKYPPTFTKGRQYSQRVERFARFGRYL